MRKAAPIYPSLLVASVLLAGCASQQERIQNFHETGRHERAITLGMEYLESHQEDWGTRRIIGDAAWAIGDTITAYNIWRPAAQVYMVQQPRLGRRIVGLALQRGDFALAHTLLQHEEAFEGSELLREVRSEMLVTVDRMRIDAIWDVQRGDSAVAHGEWKIAWEFYQRAGETFPRAGILARAHLLRAWHLADNSGEGYRKEIDSLLTASRAIDSDSHILAYLRATVLAKIGEIRAAREEYSRVTGADSEEPWRRLARSALSTLNDLERNETLGRER